MRSWPETRKNNKKSCYDCDDEPRRRNNDEGFEGEAVEAINNKVYFYSEVNRNSILRLNQSIQEVDSIIQAQAIDWNFDPDALAVEVHINSNGGEIFAGLAGVDYIRNTKSVVQTYIDGCAGSAATFLSVVGDERFINKHSFILIHQLSGWTGGTYEYLKDDMKNSDLLMKTMKDIYSEYCRIPRKKLDEVLQRDLWFDAKTALEYGLVDFILD